MRLGENVVSIPVILTHGPVLPPEHIFLIHINDLLASKRKIRNHSRSFTQREFNTGN